MPDSATSNNRTPPSFKLSESTADENVALMEPNVENPSNVFKALLTG